MMLLNNRALVLLSKSLLENLVSHKKSYILNIGSLASFGPMPFKTVYPASKAFVYSFSRGLDTEMRHRGLKVSVLCPGGIPTNKDVSDRIASYKGFVKASVLSPEKVAQIGVDNLLKNKSLIVPGFMNKLSWLMLKIIPVRWRLIIFKKNVQKEIKKAVIKKSSRGF